MRRLSTVSAICLAFAGLAAAGCQPPARAQLPAFVLESAKGSLVVRITESSKRTLQYLRVVDWDAVEGRLSSGGAPASDVVASVTAAADTTTLGRTATLTFGGVAPGPGYSLTVKLSRRNAAGQLEVVGTFSKADLEVAAGLNEVTFDAALEAVNVPRVTRQEAHEPYVLSIPAYGTPGRLTNVKAVQPDNAGGYYLIDNNQIRRVTRNARGELTIATLAGADAKQGMGFQGGTGTVARFQDPTQLTVSADGTIYVADTGNNAIRRIRIDSKGAAHVDTLAGTGLPGFADGPGGTAQFSAPGGIALDGARRLIVADEQNQRIREILLDDAGNATVRTLAGSGTAGLLNGSGGSSQFNFPRRVCVGKDHTIYVADTRNFCIRAIRTAEAGESIVSTVIGNGVRANDVEQGAGDAIKLFLPNEVIADPDGALYISDGVVRKATMDASGRFSVKTFAGTLLSSNGKDSKASSAALSGITSLSWDYDGALMSAEMTVARRIAADGAGVLQVKRFIGAYSVGSTDQSKDGPIGPATDLDLNDVAVDREGHVIATTNSHQIVRMPATPSDEPPMVIAGAGGNGGHRDGPGPEARFSAPGQPLVAPNGAIYVADTFNSCIRKLVKDAQGVWLVSTLAGKPGTLGMKDGAAGDALFGWPAGLVMDKLGALYVSDIRNHTIRKITLDQNGQAMVTTVAGRDAGTAGAHVDGPGPIARFNGPWGMAFDAAGRLLVADPGNRCIRVVSFDQSGAATVSTLVGSNRVGQFADGPSDVASFVSPISVAVRRNGDIYVIDHSRIRKVTVDALNQAHVSTFAGATLGFADGLISRARFGTNGSFGSAFTNKQFSGLFGLAMDQEGSLYVSDLGNRVIRKIIFSSPDD